ncbi:MAG: hypothetical protein GOVbin631_74 [Prokaryotic dsDNA virus sp.]|nr:MAG: hypothetical protein GOVbin631_74 [Prokaryotic dsDNA virus sp.]
MRQEDFEKFLSKFDHLMPDVSEVESRDHIGISNKLDEACLGYKKEPQKLCEKLMNNPKFYERFIEKRTSVADNERFECRLDAWVKWQESK